jgi:hypothetical protein
MSNITFIRCRTLCIERLESLVLVSVLMHYLSQLNVGSCCRCMFYDSFSQVQAQLFSL